MSMLETIRQQEDPAVAVGLDDALLGWLVESAGDGLVRWLRGDPGRAVMRKVVEHAISETVDEVVGRADPHRAEHPRATWQRSTAFDTSLRRLSQTHRTGFLALGLVPGPSVRVDQFAALAALPAAQARSTLRSLADRNLVKPARDPVGHLRY